MVPMVSAALRTCVKRREMIKILFVCLGNICRSPVAEAILKKLVEKHNFHDEIEVSSCGLGDWHEGELPNPKMRKVALERGLPLVSRAQKIREEFLDHYDLILAADKEVLNDLYSLTKTLEQRSKIHLITYLSKNNLNEDVPDPYEKNESDYHLAYEMIEEACEEFFQELKSKVKNEK